MSPTNGALGVKNLHVVILTKNEEQDLPRCLDSVTAWAPVTVVDSGSTDATCAIASQRAVLRTNDFSSFAQQRNWALDHCVDGQEWVLFIDADEVATPDFKSAVEKAIAEAAGNIAGFYCCWKTMLGECWLRRCDAFPKWQLRVVRVGHVRFIDFGHGQKEGVVNGVIGYIREPYLHYALSKGWKHWWERHNRYSTEEAQERLRATLEWSALFQANSSKRNQALKPLVSRVPFWPVFRFIHDYLIRLGFLEGRAGLVYCINMAFYEFLIRLKMEELRSTAQLSDGRRF